MAKPSKILDALFPGRVWKRNLATKADLAETERRIIAAITNQLSAADLRALESIEGRIARLAGKLKKLDEQTV